MSRDWFTSFWSQVRGDVEFGGKVEDYIIATKKHQPLDGYESDLDLALFLDFDVAVLGREENRRQSIFN